jgi:hypothetical protein
VGLIQLIVILVICGVGLYLLETYVPMAAPIRIVIRVVVVIVLVLLLLQAFGITDMRIPRVGGVVTGNTVTVT